MTNVTRSDRIKEALIGGPGLDGYAYQAEVYCVDCAESIVCALPYIPLPDDPLYRDSEMLPQPIFFGDSDYAEHCSKCGDYLYGGQEMDPWDNIDGSCYDYDDDDDWYYVTSHED